MSEIVTIVQARMTSSRLPGKVLADIDGRSSLAYMLERVQRARNVGRIVVATTVNDTDDPVAQLAERLGVSVFRGDEMDVLGRYADAAELFNADPIVRLTADCPMIDPTVIEAVVQLYRHGDWDYVGNGINRTFPDGLDVEVFSRAALVAADREAKHPFLREHVTPYIRGTYEQYESGDFRIGHSIFEADFSHIRWTLDTADDLHRIRRLVALLPDDHTWLQALSVATRFPELLGVTQSQDAES